MRQRLRAGKPAEITFTCDFHALVGGDLRPGRSVLLRYDPHRIVPAGEEHRFGHPERPVIAHLRFHEGEAPSSVPLHSPAGVIPRPDIDPTGQGSMLSAQVDVPADADHLIVWFSYATAAGDVVYDSAYGADYWFGFPCRELDVLHATVVRRPDAPADRFEVTVSATPAVADATVRFTLVADRDCARHEMRLQRTDEAAAGDRRLWAAAVDVPHGAIVCFKVSYWIGGRRLVDDNTGVGYLEPEPEPERPPPPPPRALEAAAEWR